MIGNYVYYIWSNLLQFILSNWILLYPSTTLSLEYFFFESLTSSLKKKRKVKATLCVNNFYAPLTGVLIARPRAGYSSNHNRSDCSDFSHRLPPFNRFETKLQIELKTFIVALPSGDGNSRAEFDWNLAGGERERENLQATLAARTAVSNFPDVSGLSRLLCTTSSLLRWLHSISLFGQDQCFKRNFRLVAAFRFEHWFPPLLEDSSELDRSIRARVSC